MFRLTLSILAAIGLSGCAEPPQQRPVPVFASQSSSRLQVSADRSEQSVEVVLGNAPEPNGLLTLEEALRLTLMNNPELTAFSLETRAAHARELQAGLWPNPELSVEVEEFGGTGDRRGFDAAATTLQISQPIELGHQSQKRKKVASFEKDLAHLDYQYKHLDIFSDAAKAFFEVLKAQEKLALSNELLDLSKVTFNSVEKRVAAGKDSPLEKTRASVAHTDIQIQHDETRRTLDFARKQLASFWGQDAPQFTQAAGQFDRLEPVPELGPLLDHVKQNPRYARWQTEIRKSQAALELETARTKGNITLGGGLQRFNDTDDNAVIFSVSIPLPISDRNQGARQEAVFNLAKSREEQKAAWLQLQNEFNGAYRDFTNSYRRAMSLKQDVLPGAVELFHAATRAYQEGKVDYLNVLDAQRTLFDVKNEYIESLAAYHAARTDIERFIGTRIDTVNGPESEK